MFKRSRLYIFVLCLLCMVAGCGKQADVPAVSPLSQDTKVKDAIPFLLFCQIPGNNVAARDAVWNLSAGSVQIKNSIRYKVPYNGDGNFDAITPLIWDGNKNFILHEGAVPVNPAICQGPILKARHHGIIWGKNVTAIVNMDNKGVKTYDLELQDAKHTQVEHLSIGGPFKDPTGKPMLVGDDEEVRSVDYKGGKVRFVFMNIYGQTLRAYVAYYSPADASFTWDEIPFPEDNEVAADNYPCNTLTVNDKLYLQTGEDSLEILDFKQKRLVKPVDLVKNMKSLVKDTVQPFEPGQIWARGEYKDIVLLSIPVSTNPKQWESLICAVKDDKLLGALYFRDDQVKSYNSTKQVVAVKSIKDFNLLTKGPTVYFPNEFNMEASSY